MSAIVWGADFVGTPDADDRLGARYKVRLKNSQIVLQNVARAQESPPLSPLLLLAMGTNAELAASYKSLMAADNLTGAHISYIQQAKDARDRLSEAERIQLQEAVNTKLDAGKTQAQILTAINAL